MKYALFAALLLFFTTSLNGQQIQPIQVQTIDTSTYVVEYIPIAEAQANVEKQIQKVDAQLSKVEKQMADLLKQRDQLMAQKTALEIVQKQLAEAAATPPAPASAPQSAPTQPPPSEKPKTKKKKSKN